VCILHYTVILTYHLTCVGLTDHGLCHCHGPCPCLSASLSMTHSTHPFADYPHSSPGLQSLLYSHRMNQTCHCTCVTPVLSQEDTTVVNTHRHTYTKPLQWPSSRWISSPQPSRSNTVHPLGIDYEHMNRQHVTKSSSMHPQCPTQWTSFNAQSGRNWIDP